MHWLLLLALVGVVVACSNSDDEANTDPTQVTIAAQTEPAPLETATATTASARGKTDVSPVATAMSTTDARSSPQPTEVDQQTVPSSTPEPTSTPTPAAPTPTSTPAPLSIGQTAELHDGSRITVIQVVRPVEIPGSQSNDPRTEFMAIEVEHCGSRNIAEGDTVRVNSLDWAVVMANDIRFRSVLGGMEPAIVVADLRAGECVHGWVSFKVPQHTPANFLTFTGYSHDDRTLRAKWTLRTR